MNDPQQSLQAGAEPFQPINLVVKRLGIGQKLRNSRLVRERRRQGYDAMNPLAGHNAFANAVLRRMNAVEFLGRFVKFVSFHRFIF